MVAMGGFPGQDMRPSQSRPLPKEATVADDKRRVHVGDEVELALPYSEVCMHMRVAGQLRTVRVTEHGAQILNTDGSGFSLPVTHGEAGLYRDSEGLYAPALPDQVWRIYRNGERQPVELANADACAVWLSQRAPHGLAAEHLGKDAEWDFRQEPRVEQGDNGDSGQ